MSEFQSKNVAHDRPHASPAVRKLARELGVALTDVVGSARHNRVVAQDLYQFVLQDMAELPALVVLKGL
ncbi:E3 binding domain-containing protein [Pseudomonas tolaasii]